MKIKDLANKLNLLVTAGMGEGMVQALDEVNGGFGDISFKSIRVDDGGVYVNPAWDYPDWFPEAKKEAEEYSSVEGFLESLGFKVINHLKGTTPFILKAEDLIEFSAVDECLSNLKKHRVTLHVGCNGLIEAYADDKGLYRADVVSYDDVIDSIETDSQEEFGTFLNSAMKMCGHT
jgi:hypothetical protein